MPGKHRASMTDFERLEFQRIVEELQTDRNLQFRLFWQSLTVTAVILTFCANFLRLEVLSHFPFLIVAPHIVLIPTSFILINRAKTANRKSAYLMIAFAKYATQISWERDLAIFRRRPDARTKGSYRVPHRPITLRHMLVSLFLLEFICILGFSYFFSASYVKRDVMWWIVGLGSIPYIGFYFYLLRGRLQDFFCIRYEDSIQGYATIWSDELHGLGKDALAAIGRWDTKAWSPALKRETDETYGWLWRRFYRFEIHADGTWFFTNRRITAQLAGVLILWIVFIYAFILFEKNLDNFSQGVLSGSPKQEESATGRSVY